MSTKSNPDLNWQVYQLQAEVKRLHEQMENDVQNRREQIQERVKAERRSARSWPEALQKQAALFEYEAAQWPEPIPNDPINIGPDDFFGPGAKACRRALELWQTFTSNDHRLALDIAEAQQELDNCWQRLREAIADQLTRESQEPGVVQVAKALESGDFESWLIW